MQLEPSNYNLASRCSVVIGTFAKESGLSLSGQKVAHACLLWHRTSKCGQVSTSCEEENFTITLKLLWLHQINKTMRNQLPWNHVRYHMKSFPRIVALFRTDKVVFIVISDSKS